MDLNDLIVDKMIESLAYITRIVEFGVKDKPILIEELGIPIGRCEEINKLAGGLEDNIAVWSERDAFGRNPACQSRGQ